MNGTALLAIPLLPALAAAALALRRPGAARAGRLATLASGASTAAAAVVVAGVGSSDRWSLAWSAGDGGAVLGLTADRPGALLALLAVAVGWVVQSFACRAMDGDPRRLRFHALAGALTASTATVALAASALVLAGAWVATSIALVAIVGLNRPWAPAVDAARRTRRTAAVSDVALVAGLAVLALAGHGDLRTLASSGVEGRAATAAAVLVVVAGIARSALVPLHRWLPSTIAAPTPVSALLHAGVVSGIGVLVLRLAPLVGGSRPAMALTFLAGAATAAWATTVMLARADTKGALVWSTAGQMGFMAVQLAVGALAAGLLHLLGHAMYKAALFLGAGGATTARLLGRQRPRPTTPIGRPARLSAAALVPGLAVAVAVTTFEPASTTAGTTLVAGFAWLTAARLLNGWLRSVDRSLLAAAGAGGLGVVAPFGYVALVDAFKTALGASLPAEVPGAVGAPWLWGAVAVVAAAALVLRLPAAAPLRHRLLAAAVSAGAPTPPRVDRLEPVAVEPITRVTVAPAVAEATLRAEVATAASVVAPVWPLTSFVAVNPLGGFEHLDFDAACEEAERWLGAATHLPLAHHRARHASGELGDAHLRRAIAERHPEIAGATVRLGGEDVGLDDLVVHDLVDGPVGPTTGREPTPLDPLAAYVARWCASFVAGDGLALADRDQGFHQAWRAVAPHDRHLHRLLGPAGRARLLALPEEPAAALAAALRRLGVQPAERPDVLRALVARLPGWAGLARWADEWASAEDERARLRVLDLVAVLASLDAAVGDHHLIDATAEIEAMTRDGDLLDARTDHVIGARAATASERAAVRDALGRLPERARAELWLTATELATRDRILGALHRVDPGARAERPDAQLVACIDVRSEVLRRHLEHEGAYETFGFAGFFGLPLAWQPAGAPGAEPRCPVLVRPQHAATELEAGAGGDTGRAARAGGCAAAHDAKASLGAPFTLAEAAGWLLGPSAAARTLLPSLSARVADRARALLPNPASEVVVDMPVEQRILFAEAVVRSIGMQRFAPLVVLCGHGSRTTNNPHASALDCGACGGAPGDASARVAASVLNDPDVRAGLAPRGIAIPDDTWFVAALHETAADRVSLLDDHLVPPTHHDALVRLRHALAAAGARTAAERAARLPGDPGSVRERGRDWAQVRPEWGLAGNAAMIIAPRSLTCDLDLGGRTFLHSYDPATDPDGVALETILTAPLVVAEWISMQYYFSTVDPEVLGAGDKLLHNPVGGVGVLRGDGGDLAVGFPRQSIAHGDRLAHDPVRLLAAVQAPLEQIEAVIQRNQGLRHLVENRWITLAARSTGHEPWSVRTPGGTWAGWFPAADPVLVDDRAPVRMERRA
jgi:uncharacterized protein